MGLPARSRARVGVSCVGACLLALLATSGPAAAAPKPISGKLNRGGYTVIALAANGKAKAVRAAKGGRFGVRPPAPRVTLHLRASNGRYGGPIVVGRKKRGKIAILGVRAGAKLGRIRVSARAGYARVAKKLRKRRWADASRRARARKAVPIGAGVFGRVRSRGVRTLVPGDPDLDGIPDTLDIDDDGDLILDYSDRSSAARAAQAAPPLPSFGVLSTLSLGLGETANANPRDLTDPSRPAFTDAQIDVALKGSGGLIFGSALGPGGGSSELDCAGDPGANPPRPGLTYCSRGGSGRAFVPGQPPPPPGVPRAEAPFPGDPGGPFDPDGDVFGTLAPFLGLPQLLHGATTAEIKTGDVLIERAKTGAFTTTLQYVFATVPALASYDDDGPGGTPPKPLAYPYPPGFAHDLTVAPRPAGDPSAGDVVVTLTFWRPQRRRIAQDPAPQPGESAAWTDIGGGVGYGAGAGPGPCPQSAFSEDDPNLTDPGPPPSAGGGPIAGGGGFRDQAPDRPANTNNKLTYTLNLTQCLKSKGSESSFDQSGEVLLFSLLATGRGGRADQGLSFKRQ